MSKKPFTGSYLEAGDNEATEQELQDVAFTAISISVIAFTILITNYLFFHLEQRKFYKSLFESVHGD